jgi:putative colanic acid biosynthesis glycosyltransferase WcaI
VLAAASALERLSYRLADAVTVLSDDLRDNVAGKLPARMAAKVRVIPNFVDTDAIRPMGRLSPYRSDLGIGDEPVVLYAGNVGFSQSLDLVLDAASTLGDEDDLRFVINGGGSALEDLRRRAEHLDNVVFVGMQPRERLPEVLAAADVHLVPLKRGLARSSVPSKLYSILAAARPIVASVDAGTEVASTLGRAGAGVAVEPDQPEAFTKAISWMLENPDEARRMGASGRAFVEHWASPGAVAEAYEQLFAELAR